MVAIQKLAVSESQISDGANELVELSVPYVARITIEGVEACLFHAWNTESVKEKGRGAKGSDVRKTDNLESYVYRDPQGNLGIPGMNFRAALALAAKSEQDPRSPRKSMFDLCKAVILPLTMVAPFEPATTTWDYEDSQHVTVQRAGITRIRPAMRAGWRCSFDMLVNAPEYIPPQKLQKLVNNAGKFVGLLDFRPTYGRFIMVAFETGLAD